MHSDKHVHTPYCLHGSSDAMENYVKVAIEAGLESLHLQSTLLYRWKIRFWTRTVRCDLKMSTFLSD